MIKTTQDRIEEIKKNGYTLDFGNVFNHAFENYKKIALGTRASHVLTAHNTNLARTCLTSQNGRDGVRLTLV